jgi:hypothetical protein
MNKTKQSHKAIFNFIANANVYLKINQEETKLKYAIERTGESVNKAVQAYQLGLKDLKLEHALSEANGKVPFTTNEQGEREYEYTKEGLKALDKAIENLFNEEVEIEVYYATELPETLDESFKQVFKGFVIE